MMEERVLQNFDVASVNTRRLGGRFSQINDSIDDVWRLHFEVVGDPSKGFDLDLHGETIFGTAINDQENAVDLRPYNGVEHGVSRRHLRLLATMTDLVVIDLKSTNSTHLNQRQLKPQTPYQLMDGDILSLGRLELMLRVITRPGESSTDLRAQADLADALLQIGKAINAEMDLHEIFSQAVDLAMSLTSAGEASIWVIDPTTEQFHLTASRTNSAVKTGSTKPLPSHPILARVVQTGEPFRSRPQDLVRPLPNTPRNAALYVPLQHRRGVIGVMGVVHRYENSAFTARDERLLAALADFVAIAARNACLYGEVLDTDRLKGEMIQNVAHEFRTPLTYAVGYMALMLEESEKLDTEHLSHLQLIYNQMDRLQWLIKNFVSLATLEQVVAERAPVDPANLVREAWQAARIAAEAAIIDLQLVIEPDLPLVHINELSILQVIDNLVSNALKFTPAGGCVVIKAAFNYHSNRVVISVSDTGIGIPAVARHRIFDRFYQVDGTATRRYSGLGIGLALCKAIVEAHGEDIGVHCPAEGSVFSFTLRPVPTLDGINDKFNSGAFPAE